MLINCVIFEQRSKVHLEPSGRQSCDSFLILFLKFSVQRTNIFKYVFGTYRMMAMYNINCIFLRLKNDTLIVDCVWILRIQRITV